MDSLNNIKVFVIEDELCTCEEIARVISDSGECDFLGFRLEGNGVGRALKEVDVDVLILDINLSDGDGIELIPEILRWSPDTEILVYTLHDTGKYLIRALEKGATGYLIKPASDRELIDGIVQIHGGGSPISPSIARQLIGKFREMGEHKVRLQELTAREVEVLRLVTSGKFDKEIGELLGVSTRTVNTHVRNIYKKLQVNSRTEAAAVFLRSGN